MLIRNSRKLNGFTEWIFDIQYEDLKSLVIFWINHSIIPFKAITGHRNCPLITFPMPFNSTLALIQTLKLENCKNIKVNGGK